MNDFRRSGRRQPAPPDLLELLYAFSRQVNTCNEKLARYTRMLDDLTAELEALAVVARRLVDHA